jgi:hypothetical protein
MKKHFGIVMAVAALAMVLAWTGSVQAYTVTGDVTPGWGTLGGSLWYDVLKETASSTAGGYDPQTYGVMVRPPTTTDLPNPINPTNHNWTEVNYLLVTGQFGQRALYSVGELDPRFGNKTATLTCKSGNKKGRGCDNNGQCDLVGAGREVKKVSNIEVVHAFTHMKGVPGDVHPFSPWLVVSGAGITPKTYDLADLQAMHQVTFDASTSTSNTKGIWTGPRLVDVLKASGVDTKDMDSYIIVQATDGYSTLLSMYEATHKLGITDPATCPACQPEYILLGISDTLGNTLNNGTCTDPVSANTTCKDGGFVRTVNPGDLAAGRWVSNAAQIIVYKLNPKGW